ncbi:MAG: tetratricopeptide repeat protein [Pseudomonadota bacterium]
MLIRTYSPFCKLAGAAISTLAIAACGSTKSAVGLGDDQYREAIGVYSEDTPSDEGLDPIAAAAFWGTRYNTSQSDPEVAVKFSQALRKINSNDEAVEVMFKANQHMPDNADVSLEYGKVLVQSGRAFEAVRHLENAVAQKPRDWKALSAYGVALDQIGEHKEARKKYDQAHTIAPGAVSIMNNKGLSFALDGDLGKARMLLNQAAGRAGGDARVRQNLALVLALSGDLGSAERLARSDLPPQVANNNIDFFRQLMNQPAYWSEYAGADIETPSFDDAPAAPLKPNPAPLPRLREEPKPEDKKADDSPVALIEATPVTNTAATGEPGPLRNGDDKSDGGEE